MTRLLPLLALLWAAGACAQPVVAHRHMAATASPFATEAALSALRDGGTAADATAAAQMVLAVTEPNASGLGGGSVLMLWDNGRRELSFLEGLSSAPAFLPEDWSHDNGADLVALKRSGRLVAVPGTVRTVALLHGRAGRLPWARLFRDAIALAEDGFPMRRYFRSVLLATPALASLPDFAIYYGPDGRPLPVGGTVRNPALAATLRLVAAEGPDGFYGGPVAAAVLGAVDAPPHAGAMTADDLRGYRTVVRAPVCAGAWGRRVCSAAPPVAGGVALLQELMLLDRLHLQDTRPGSVEAAHLLLEAARLAEADRRAFIGDPDQVRVPTDALLDGAYMDARARLVDPGRAMVRAQPGHPPGQAALPPSDPATQPATSHVAVVDDAGNAVSFTTTVNLNFGALAAPAGVVLNDAVANFARVPAVNGVRVANAAAPGKRPVSTMAPTIVFAPDGRPELVVGAGGGARIIDSVAQTIAGVLAWHMDVRTAIEQGRIGGENRAQELERGTGAAGLADGLRTMGHDVRVVPMNAGVQAVAVRPGGTLDGWGDRHRDGTALGD